MPAWMMGEVWWWCQAFCEEFSGRRHDKVMRAVVSCWGNEKRRLKGFWNLAVTEVSEKLSDGVCVCVCVCVCARARACVRACVRLVITGGTELMNRDEP
jgi:hypothetical protein